MAPKTEFPPVRACLFDMDGLLIDTEDIYTRCINIVLARYNRPSLPWHIKARLQGRPGPQAHALFQEWAQLPIDHDQYIREITELQSREFPTTQPLPGTRELLESLDRTKLWETNSSSSSTNPPPQSPNGLDPKKGNRVHIALATSSNATLFSTKTSHLAPFFSPFPEPRRVKGDDPRIPPGRGKPLPDIFLLSLETINSSLPPGEPKIQPSECLVFEDSVPGVEAGRRAGMRVIWCPHPMLKKEYEGREKDVLAGRTLEAGEVDMHQVGEHDDGWADYLTSLEEFDYGKYGIVVPPKE